MAHRKPKSVYGYTFAADREVLYLQFGEHELLALLPLNNSVDRHHRILDMNFIQAANITYNGLWGDAIVGNISYLPLRIGALTALHAWM